jgi:hypothetical protein
MAMPVSAQEAPPDEVELPLGRGAAFGPLAAEPVAAVRAGTALRSRPDVTAEVLLPLCYFGLPKVEYKQAQNKCMR